MNGNERRDSRKTQGAPSRSWMSAGWGSRMRPRPSVSTMTCRLRPFTFLRALVASRAAALGGLDALAVEHRGRGRRLAADPLAISHDEQVLDRLEQALVTPSAEPAEDRAPRRQVARQKPPRDAAAQEIKDRIEDLPQRPFPRPPSGTRLWHQGLDQ